MSRVYIISELCYESLEIFNDKKGLLVYLRDIFSQQDIQEIKTLITEDKGAFVDLYSAFDQKQEDYFSEVDCEEELRLYVNELFSNGFAKIENVFSEDELEEVKEFQDLMQEAIFPDNGISGYIVTPYTDLSKNSEQIYPLWREVFSHRRAWHPNAGGHANPKEKKHISLSPALPNDGQQRIQSKNLGIHPPGINTMVEKPILCKIFAHYNNLKKYEIDRSTLEFIFPAPINHNGWHRDTAFNELKAMILLEDVDEYTAPILSAIGSHRAKKDFDKQHLHDMFVMTPNGKFGDPSSWPANTRWPEYAIHKDSSHNGYISHEHAPFNMSPSERIQKHVVINDCEYELGAGTGKAGDVLFFETCALHSGTRAHFKSRRNISLSSAIYSSPKTIFFNMLNDFV